MVWATNPAPQSTSLLAGEEVEYVPYVAPRDWVTVLRNTTAAQRIIRRHDVTRMYTTGAGIALSFLPVARAMGVECHYVESAARTDGPSVTGRIAALIPGVSTYTQYETWTSPTWRRAPSVFDGFAAAARHDPPQRLKVVVTVGTIKYPFRALFERLLDVLPPDADVLWQTGSTPVDGLPLRAAPSLPHADLLSAMRGADVVVAHAGIGSALASLEAGRAPLLVPRRESRGEHVDDHQVQIAKDLHSRGLAVHVEVHALDGVALGAVAGLQVAAHGGIR